MSGIEPYIGEIAVFAGNFEPRGWAFCNGQLLSISRNTALFAVLGTTYGGNGQTTFALPNLRDRVPTHAGQGPDLTNRTLGEQGGSETVTLTGDQLPAHAHGAGAASGAGTSPSPQDNVWAGSRNRDTQYAGSANATMKPDALASAGGGQPHNNMSPYLTVNYIIALEGIFPPRN